MHRQPSLPIMLFALPALLLRAVAWAGFPDVEARQTFANPVVTSNLLSDGSCFYPIPDSDFPDLIHFVGRWFQVAATVDPSSPPDTCKYADINMNVSAGPAPVCPPSVPLGVPGPLTPKRPVQTTDNSLLVTSVCQRGGNQLVEHGTAEPAPSQFGSAGAFILRFVGVEVPGQNCPGPNYVVQSFDADAGWAIVQTPSFASMQLLSRQPVRSDRDIQVSPVLLLHTPPPPPRVTRLGAVYACLVPSTDLSLCV